MIIMVQASPSACPEWSLLVHQECSSWRENGAWPRRGNFQRWELSFWEPFGERPKTKQSKKKNMLFLWWAQAQPGLRLREGRDNLDSVLPALPADGVLRPWKIRNEWHGWKAFQQYEDTILHALHSKVVKEWYYWEGETKECNGTAENKHGTLKVCLLPTLGGNRKTFPVTEEDRPSFKALVI